MRCKRLGRGGHIELALRSSARPDRASSRREIIIRDDGPGIAPEIRGHIFDPFYSGRPAGRGLGLGLSKCWRIVTAHGGSNRRDRAKLVAAPSS